MTRNTHMICRFVQRQASIFRALGLAVLVALALGQVTSAEAHHKRPPAGVNAAVALAKLPAPVAMPSQGLGYSLPRQMAPEPGDTAPIWLASNVDSAYLAGVRSGRFASLKTIKTAIQAFTGVAIKRVLSIAMNQGVLALTVEDVYSNIFTINVQPETAQILQ